MRRVTLPLLGLLLLGCEPVSRPNRPLPAIEGTYLDGRALSKASLAGKPWVVNLWVPG